MVDVILSYLSSLPENEAIVSNVLSMIMELNGVLELNFQQNVILTKFVLCLVTEENSPLGIVKRAAHILNTYFSNPSIIEWLKNEESLEGSLQILGRKIAIIGDYECQTFIFEALCRFITDEDKIKWARTWFPDEKTRSLFLNLNPPQFEMDCRKILNHINRSEPNPRTHAFVATEVYFGPFQLKKPCGLEFWIDFNYDSRSISFFCSEFGPDLLCHDLTWETILISSDIVDYYTVQNKRIMKSKEICIYLKCVCNDLLPVGSPIFPEFQTNCIRIIFWSFQDINQPLEMTFGKSVDLDNGLNTESQGNSSTSQNYRKVSNSADVLSIQKGTDDRVDFRKVSVCSVLEIPDKEEQCERIGRRVSDSTDIIHLSDTNKKQMDHHNIPKNDTGQKNIALNKRKASCSSMNLKESDSESDIQRSDIKTHISVKNAYSSIDNNSADVEKLNIEGEIKYYRNHDVEKFPSTSASVRKSSDASCNIDVNNEDSQSDVDEQVEKNASESLLKDEEKSLFQENGVVPKNISSNENEDFNLFQRKGQKIDENYPYFPETSQISSKILKEPLHKDSKTIKNVDQNTSLQTEEVNVSFDRNFDSQNSLRVENSKRKVSQSFSDLGDTCISPTPVNKRKLPRKTNKLISKPCKDFIHSKNQTFVKSPISIKADENKALNTITFNNSQPINFKNSNSESYYVKDLSQNSRQKKIRLYNINKDPVYDVPPHQKKKLNDNVIKDSTVIESFKKDHEKLFSNSAEKKIEDICKSKERVDVLHKNPSNLLIAEKYLHTTLNNVENKLSSEDQELENIVHENVENKNQEKSPKEDENEYLTEKKSACYEPKPKKLKKYHDFDTKYSPGRRLERQVNEIGKETISQSFSTKKPRIAALNAMKKNKTILKQKTSEKGSEICNFNQSSKRNDNFHKIEENISSPTKTAKKSRLRQSEDYILTPTNTEKSPRLRKSEENILTPTKTAKKPRLKKSEENILTPSKKPRLRKSVFTTDTETGSSEVSWFGQKRSYLFETPKKIYSNRKNKQETKDSHSRQRTYKSRNTVSRSKKKQNIVSLLPELKSKNTLSDLENYELLIERKSNYKSASYFNRDNPRITENVLDTLGVHDCEEKSNIEDNNNNQVYSNIKARIHKTSNHNTEEEWDIQDVEDNDYFTSEAMKQIEIANDNLNPNFTVAVNMNKGQLKQAISNKVKSGSPKLSNPKKIISNEDLHIERVSEQLSLSSSTKKRKSNDFPTFNKRFKKVKRNDIAAHHISLDTITNSEISCNAYADNKSLLTGSNSSNKITSHFSKVSNNYSPNVPIAIETRLKDSPIINKSNGYNVSYRKKNVECDNFIPEKDMLSEENLTSLNNEISGKRLHMQRFLESLSGDSNSPKDIQYDNIQHDNVMIEKNFDEIMKHSNFKKGYVSVGKEKAELTSVKDSTHLKKRKKYFASINDSKKSPGGLNSKRTSEKDSEKLPLLENFSNYWPSEEKIDNHGRICKTKEKKRSKSFAILDLLAGEVNNLTRSLLGTLQKCSQDFSAKVASLRENISVTASALTSEDFELPQKDLKNFAVTCKQNRINAEKSLKKMLSIGQEYFEAEKRYDDKMKKLYRKAVKKYATKIEMAEKIATKALEETIISKTDTFLKNIVKKIDDL
ncbi:SYCP2_SLD domain-containing protein [Trichonephila inaurata madagascariensis]|uniref:SYCP2_SLD domain-containing protein n=1 Tax=Trichonephila inaurata madagascariensis TaxID=2747483 RepID=A0A8X7BZW4_9ARAC|nr:SYCP2_SLD domain-containing protein [Trichonephila inaurata madagascariensis]